MPVTMRFIAMVLIFAFLFVYPAASRDILPVMVRQDSSIYAGPGKSFAVIGEIDSGVEVDLLERNNPGTWVRIREDALNGWILSGHLEFGESFNLGQVPLNVQVADGDPQATSSMHEALLNLFPVVPTAISENMRAVYERGQLLGNQPLVATKIGDSVLSNEWYLLPMSASGVELGPYTYLQPALELFGPGMSDSVAVRKGLTSGLVFDPFWADKTRCQPNEEPLSCEYRLKRPSVAFVMFSHNDMRAMPVESYRQHMQRLVEELLTHGVIPVLITFSSHPEAPDWEESLEYNVVLLDTATRYQIPLINLWLATRALPDYGLEADNIHLKNSGYDYLTYTNGQEAQSGVALLNLLSLHVLDMLRVKLDLAGSVT